MIEKERPPDPEPVDQDIQDMIDAVEAGEPYDTWSTGTGEKKT